MDNFTNCIHVFLKIKLETIMHTQISCLINFIITVSKIFRNCIFEFRMK